MKKYFFFRQEAESEVCGLFLTIESKKHHGILKKMTLGPSDNTTVYTGEKTEKNRFTVVFEKK